MQRKFLLYASNSHTAKMPQLIISYEVMESTVQLGLTSGSDLTFVMQIRLSDPAEYQSIVDAEWNIIYDKLAKCAESGAQIVLSRLAIGDLATQYFADRGIFCAGRVSL